MRIEAIHAREVAMRLTAPFETSFGVTQDRRILLIELVTDGAAGWGEVTAPEAPFYNSETVDTAWLVLREFIAPLVLGREFELAEQVAQSMQPVRGHEMAKAALENAFWHAQSLRDGNALSRQLGGSRSAIECGVSLGIHRSTAALIDRIEQELAAGYRRIKLKIKPESDVAVVAAVRDRFPAIHLTVDANSAYTLEDLPVLQQLDEFGLDYIEQPLEWNEIYRHAQLQKQLRTPICLDECIHSLRDAQAAVELGACRVINIKLGRVSGHCEARRIEQYCRAHGVPVWCGGMLESGIGRAHNIAMSTLPGFVLPGDVSATRRYWSRDLVAPEVMVDGDGTIRIPDTPGLGYEIDRDFVDRLTVRSESWTNKASVARR